MEERITARELLGGGMEGFDPLTLDTTEIRELSNAIPRDGSIDINQAEVLATKMLRGADMCSELLAIATVYASKADTQKRKAYSYAAMVKASAAGVKTDKQRMWSADIDDEYIKACNKYSEAIGFVKWIDSKYESFTKMHYLCKKMLERAYPHEAAGGWNGRNEIPDSSKMDNERGSDWVKGTYADTTNRWVDDDVVVKDIEQEKNNEGGDGVMGLDRVNRVTLKVGMAVEKGLVVVDSDVGIEDFNVAPKQEVMVEGKVDNGLDPEMMVW